MKLHLLFAALLRLLMGCQGWLAWQPGNPSLICDAIATSGPIYRKPHKYRSC